MSHLFAPLRLRELTQVDQVPVGHASILGRVLAHGCDHDAIGEFELSHLKGREQFCSCHQLPFSSQVSSSLAAALRRNEQLAKKV